MTKEFNSLEELEPYYYEDTNTYIFGGNGVLLDIKLNFDLCVDANIMACDINAGNIVAWTITAGDITARDITAHDIATHNIDAHNIKACNIEACNIVYANNIDAMNIEAGDIYAGDIGAFDIDACNICFNAFCIAYKNIKCTSIKGRRENHIAKALDGEIIIKGESKC